MNKEEHYFVIFNLTFKLAEQVCDKGLAKNVPNEYWEIESEDVQASILKGVIEQSSQNVQEASP